jgi:site-specific DNA-methyltransferase (adenine-specific)
VRYEVIHGDCLEVMAGMEAGSVDAVVTDPPYGIRFMGKAWDGAAIEEATEKRRTYRACDDPRAGENGGYRSAASEAGRYDFRLSGNLAFQAWCEAWATEALRVLKPSHYLLAFSGTRTWHRLACALEDAGFEIRDTLMWLYGSGFPKGKACLKPAWEPIILARKPGPMRELGIEECRVGTEAVTSLKGLGENSRLNDDGWKGIGQRPEPTVSVGRWPANLILDEEAALDLDMSVGHRHGAGNKHIAQPGDERYEGGATPFSAYRWAPSVIHDNGGLPSRYFYCAKASRVERNKGLEGMPKTVAQSVAMGDKAYGTLPYTNEPREMNPQPRQNHHPTVKPLSLMRWLTRLVSRPGDLVLDPFTGSGTTGVACVEESRDFIGIEREAEYVEIARRRIEAADAQQRLVLEGT